QGVLFAKELSTSFPTYYTWLKYRLTYNWAARPNLLFRFRTAVNYGGFKLGTCLSEEAKDFGTQLGIKNLMVPGTPNISIQNSPGPGSHTTYLNDGPNLTVPVESDVAWTKGAHNLKFGGTYVLAAPILRFSTLP